MQAFKPFYFTMGWVFFGKTGTIILPEIDIPWWNIDQKKLERAILPALKLEITPSPMAASGPA